MCSSHSLCGFTGRQVWSVDVGKPWEGWYHSEGDGRVGWDWLKETQGAGRQGQAATAGWPSILREPIQALEGANRVVGRCCPSSAAAPSFGSHPGHQLGWEHLRLPCLEAWSPKHRPTGARQKGGGWKWRAVSSIRVPPARTAGPRWARAVRSQDASLCVSQSSDIDAPPPPGVH